MLDCCKCFLERNNIFSWNDDDNTKITQLKRCFPAVLKTTLVAGGIISALGLIPGSIGLVGIVCPSSPYWMCAFGNSLTFYGIGFLLGGGSLAIAILPFIIRCKTMNRPPSFKIGDFSYYDPSCNDTPSAPPFETQNFSTNYYQLLPATPNNK
ncbi:MAG: hypothetical protein KDK55_04820 [Chlamydiia bacterium]|nr:hypothetical protein [Chlamydiia bacterium]